MDYTALALIVGIALYTLFEYRRREQIHKETMICLKRGQGGAILSRKPDFWKLLTTSTMAVILLVLTVVIFVFGLARGKYFFVPSLAFGTVFGLITVILVLIVLRDWKLYKIHRDGSGEMMS